MSTFHDPGSWGDYAIWTKAANDFSLSSPYEAKCLYVLGTIRHLTHAANNLYPGKSDHRLPATILGFNIVELLGRCLKGDTDHRDDSGKRIKKGLRYIAKHHEENRPKTIYTLVRSYEIPSEALVALRNFTAHGFYGSPDSELAIDGLFVAWLFGSIAEATQQYYDELKMGERCEEMLRATIHPLCNPSTGKLTRIEPVQTTISNGLLLSQPIEKDGEGEETWNWSADYTEHDYDKKRKYDSKSHG